MIPLKKKKFISAAALLLALALVLCGCGSMKSAWIAARFGSAIRKNPITAVGGSLRGEITGKTLGVDSGAALELEFETRMDPETGKSYSDLHSTVTVLGMRVPQHLEIYHLPGEAGADYYIHLVKPSLWARGKLSTDQVRGLELDPALLMLIMERASDTAEILTAEEQGVRNHLLKLTFRPGDLQEFLTAAGVKLPGAAEELNGVTIPVEVEINSQTSLPQRLRIQVLGLSGDGLRDLLKAAGMELKGVEPESGSITLEITRFGFGPQSVPELPAEAVGSADQMDQLREFFRMLLP